MKEIWVTIKHHPSYKVSSEGRIKNRQGKILQPFFNDKKHPMVQLYKNSVCRQYRVSRLVAEAFIDGFYEDCRVVHIDEDKCNNQVDNLFLMDHAGAARYWCKLNKFPRKVICVETKEVFESCKDAANKLGVPINTVYQWTSRHLRSKDKLHYRYLDEQTEK